MKHKTPSSFREDFEFFKTEVLSETLLKINKIKQPSKNIAKVYYIELDLGAKVQITALEGFKSYEEILQEYGTDVCWLYVHTPHHMTSDGSNKVLKAWGPDMYVGDILPADKFDDMLIEMRLCGTSLVRCIQEVKAKAKSAKEPEVKVAVI